MTKPRWSTSLVLAVLWIAVVGCESGGPPAETPAPDDGRLAVAVSIPPHAMLVERIGEDAVTVTTLLPPGESPATYSPTPAELAEASKASVYFRTGVPMEESLLDKLRRFAPEMRVVDLRQGIELRTMEGTHDHAHDHAHDHGHGHAHHDGRDPHSWLDPLNMVRQATTVRQTLAELAPGKSDAFAANSDALTQELESLDTEIAETLAPVEGRALYVFHPAYGYFCDRYDLRQVAIETEGKDPTPQQLAEFIRGASDEKVDAVFVQPQFGKAAAQSVADAIGGEVVMLDPLAKDYISNMREMAGRIVDALGSGSPPRE